MEVASTKASTDSSVKAVFMESLTFYSTKASISVSTAAGMKSSKLFLRRFGRKLVEVFFHGSYFYGIYFHERLDGSFHEDLHELHAETASHLWMLPSNLPFKLPHIWRKMGPYLLFAEASMVAASMDASVEVVGIVPHLHRHP